MEGLALELGGLVGDCDSGLLLGGRRDSIEAEVGKIPQQGREAVHGQAPGVVLVSALRRARSETWAGSTDVSGWAGAAAGSSS